MNRSIHAHARAVPLPVLAVVALLAALLAGPAVAGQRTHGEAARAHHASARLVSGHHRLNRAELRFHDRMRKLWEDHVTWTRLAIVTFADGSDGFGDTAARLLQNQTDLGDAFKPFYGKAAGRHLTALLHDHITIAVELLQAAKAGDGAAFDDANARWYANGDDVADFLSSLDHRAWPRAEMRSMMREHLDQTLAEASAELTGDYPASVAAYGQIHRHILHMADDLSAGILRRFPLGR
jgi:hypothetical protein